MAARQLKTLLEDGCFLEGPRWRGDRFWVSDFYRHRVFTVTLDGREETIMEVENRPSGLGWMPDGSLLVVSMTDKRVLRRTEDGEVSEHADVAEYCGGDLNDMVVDSNGRAYVGNYGFDLMHGADPELANLIRVDPDGATTVAAADMYFPNGLVVTPDGRTLIVGETAGARYSAFDIEPDGSLTNRRIWAQIAPTPELGPLEVTLPQLKYGPDGCCLDAEGHIWSADSLGGRCCRIAPGGEIVEEITAPEGLGIFACMLGGDDGRTLLLCSAPDFAEENRKNAREAVLLTTTVEVPHAGLP